MSGESETPFEGVLRQINDTVPFEPGYYNESYLDRRITARMRRRDTESHTESTSGCSGRTTASARR